MADLVLRGASDLHLQIRRLQAALQHQQQSYRQHRPLGFSDEHSRTPAPPPSTLSEAPPTDCAQPVSVAAPYPPPALQQPLPLREGSVNRNGAAGSGRRNVKETSLFSSVVIAGGPFEDLIMRAWGSSGGGDAACQSTAVPATCASQAVTKCEGLSSPLERNGAASICSVGARAAGIVHGAGRGSHTRVVRDTGVAGGGDSAAAAASRDSATLISTKAAPRPGRRAADTRCRVTSVVAASQPTAEPPRTVRDTERHNRRNSSPLRSTGTTTVTSMRGPSRIVSSSPSLSFPATAATTSLSNANSAAAAANHSIVDRGMQPPLARQQHLLSRIQMLDRVLDCGRSGKSGVQATRLLRRVTNDQGEPYFAAGPVDWAAVRRLRERLVQKLLGTPPSAFREASQPRVPPPSPTVFDTAPTSTHTWPWPTREDTPTVHTSSFELSPSASSCATSTAEVSGVAPPLASAAAAAATSSRSAETSTGTSVDVVDVYAASQAMFQREIEAMRCARARRQRQPPTLSLNRTT